ncbi:MAG: cytochrome b N-terminal domain-containing protein [Planctomycetaceae bacterium]|nr:cytochrome b N-terminal domain-containing protein [Planctomycetaceae bacterium]
MISSIIDWIDDRTGIKGLMHEALFERIPGGARWRYVWGSTLMFAFFVQAVTGICLWMSYAPSGQTAWESVYYIQHEMYGGWLLRGIHHFMAQTMVVLLALHLMQVVIDGAYRAPREFNFWIGLVLMKITLGLSLTGYLLPWDQKGYWATRVATNLAGIVPIVGPSIQKLVVGGPDYGHFTLTRFFALHVGVLPALLAMLVVPHLLLLRKHGLHAKQPLRRPEGYFWPEQVLKDAVACLAVLCVVLFLVFQPAIMGTPVGDHPGDVLGAHLDAPADRANEYSAARPEWYFLFLFQFLKLFEGMGATGELIGAIIAPGAIMGVLFLMPIIGNWNLGHRFNVLFTFVLLIGAGLLTFQALWDDRQASIAASDSALLKPLAKFADPSSDKFKQSQAFLAAVDEAGENAHRAIELARAPRGIPNTGLLSVLNEDPKTQGPRLFRRYCGSCHAHFDPATGKGVALQPSAPVDANGNPLPNPEPYAAPNLYRFASREWIAGVLDPELVTSVHYFGATKHKDGEMAAFVKGDLKPQEFAADIKLAVIALSAEAGLPAQRQLDLEDASKIKEGQAKLKSLGCVDCHKFQGDGELGTYPDLTGYGSYEWLKGMIANPEHPRFYPEGNDRMPKFADSDKAEDNTLSAQNLDLIVRWLRGEWYEATGH